MSDGEAIPICPIPADRVMQVWDRAEPVLARVVKPDTGHSLDTLLTALQLETELLWIIGDFQGVVVTSIMNRPVQRVLWVNYLAGKAMDLWLSDLSDILELHARTEGCTAIEFNGRKGWSKLREHHPEYEARWITFRREL